MKIKNIGLIGKNLSHSFSKKYFESKFKKENISDYQYDLFELDTIEDFRELIDSNPELIGLNVTIPYKQSIIPYLDELDEEAEKVGAVNTIKIFRDDSGVVTRTIGYNTDVFGFAQSIKPFLKLGQERALIIGTGGASKAVHYLLEKKLGLSCLFVSRNPSSSNQISYQEVNEFVVKYHTIIINTTPIGMFPLQEELINFPFQYLTKNHLVVDLIYNPEETLFLKEAKLKEARVINGLTMLHQQAEKSWDIWR